MPLYSDKADSYLSPEELRHMRALYAGEATMVDRWFGIFMDKVRLLGLDKNTVICVVSDHGHQLGEKNFTGKLPWGLIPALMDIVFAVRTPDCQGGGQCFSPFVTNTDILPTLMGLAGEETPEWCEGLDIWPVVRGEKEQLRDHVTSCFKDHYWVRDEEYALVTDCQWKHVELYDVVGRSPVPGKYRGRKSPGCGAHENQAVGRRRRRTAGSWSQGSSVGTGLII